MTTGVIRKILAKAFRIFESTVWNANGRAESKELQDIFGRSWVGENPPNYGACVVGGLQCSGVGGTLNSIVAPGACLIYDTAIPGGLAGDSQYAFVSLEVATTITHDVGDPADPRIDVVYLTGTKGNAPGATADVKRHPLDGGGVEVGLATQEGNIPTLGILKGTPGPVPVADLAGVAALDGVPLYAVFVPATEVDAANFLYADRRAMRAAPGAVSDRAMVFRGAPGAVFNTTPGDYKQAMAAKSPLVRVQANGRNSLAVGWDSALELPYFFRDVGALTGVGFGGDVYPMMQANGPSQIVSYPLRVSTDDHSPDGGGPGVDYSWDSTAYGTHITHIGVGLAKPVGSFLVPSSARGVKPTRAWVTSQHFAPFVTGILRMRLLMWDESAASLINLIDTGPHPTGYQTLADIGPGNRSTQELALDAALLPAVMSEGDFLVFEVSPDFQAADAATEVFAWTGRIEWTDGRG